MSLAFNGVGSCMELFIYLHSDATRRLGRSLNLNKPEAFARPSLLVIDPCHGTQSFIWVPVPKRATTRRHNPRALRPDPPLAHVASNTKGSQMRIVRRRLLLALLLASRQGD